MWNKMAQVFDELAKNGDANVEWTFDAKGGVRRQWLLQDSPTSCAPRKFWEAFATAGSMLPKRGAPYSEFPTKLLSEPSPDWRWLAALRHLQINVVYAEPTELKLRTDAGAIDCVAEASARLCLRMARFQGRKGGRRLVDLPVEVSESTELLARVG